jgi:putative ABC transport system permease protein
MPAMRDLRYALRQLLASPGYTAVASLTLALGMGATTAFFSVLYGVVLAPPPYPDGARLASLVNTRPETAGDGERLSRAEMRDILARQRAFSSLGAAALGRMTLDAAGGGAFAERIKVSDVTPEVFAALGIPAALGRTFTAADAGAGRLAVIGDGLWRARFGASPDVVGRTVPLNGQAFTIIGVMPAGFAYPEPDMGAWLALDLRPRDDSDRDDRYLFTVGRLADGVSLRMARDDLGRVASELRRTMPAEYPSERWTLDAATLRDRQFGHLELPLTVLFAGAAAVLLVACVNVAIMALLRAVSRRRELSIRMAIGASRATIVRQLLTEAALVAALGAVGGSVVASTALSALIAAAPAGTPRLDAVGLDLPAWLFSAGMLAAVTLAVGLAPALVPAALRGGDALIASARVSDGRAATRLRDLLTVVEVGLAAALVICAGLTLRSLQGLLRVDVGFETTHRVSFKTNLTAQRYPDAASADRFYGQLMARLEAAPGIRRVAAISYVPLSYEGSVVAAAAAAPIGTPPPTPVVRWGVVRGPYFETMGIEVLRGRAFGSGDVAGGPGVVIVDETLARRWWQREDAALGQQVRIGDGPDAETRTVVGVVRRVAHNGPADAGMPTLYAPQTQVYQRGMYTVVESSLAFEAILEEARRAVAAVDPAVPIYFAETSSRRYADVVALPRFTAGLASAFSMVALVLAGVGVFGVTAYAVSQRTREFGIRLALGAQQTGIGALVLRRVAGLVAAGLVAGGALALGLGQLMSGLLVRVEPDDPVAFAASAGALALTALVAALAPMRAAVRVDPAVTLRAE